MPNSKPTKRDELTRGELAAIRLIHEMRSVRRKDYKLMVDVVRAISESVGPTQHLFRSMHKLLTMEIGEESYED